MAQKSSLVLIYESARGDASDVARRLGGWGHRVTTVDAVSEAEDVLRGDGPVALVVVGRDSTPWTALGKAAGGSGVPVLAVVEDPSAAPAADDWVSAGRVQAELSVRLDRLTDRHGRHGGGRRSAAGALGPRLIALIAHDLRNPLNVIKLSLAMIARVIPKNDPEMNEDFRYVEENFRQLEGMLNLLADYYKLFEREWPVLAIEFAPRRFLQEVIESMPRSAGVKPSAVSVELSPSSPVEVKLDPRLARLAFEYVLVNAAVAANGGPIRIIPRGGPDRWVTEIVVDAPPGFSVKSETLSVDGFERLCGAAAERTGMDLAIATKVSQIFGGSARIEAEEGLRTVVVLDWPARYAAKPGPG